MSQTITPEERRAEDQLVASLYNQRNSAIYPRVIRNVLRRVKKEALAQGWDEAADYVKEYLGLSKSDVFVLAECNPHRNA